MNTLLRNSSNYLPDTINLYEDTKAAEYWFACFRDLSDKFARQAAASQQEHDSTAEERAAKFHAAYLEDLAAYERTIMENYQKRTSDSTTLGIRELLELNEKHLRRFGFPDPWLHLKCIENERAVALLKERLQEIDNLTNDNERWTELVRGVLAGNMFDWGAQAVTNILENENNFGLHAALARIEKRPWLIDNLDSWLERIRSSNAHKSAVIFVDNSGVDIVLGIIPFARELLKRGTKVLLCANTEPSINDVTSKELLKILEKCCCYCEILEKARRTQRLLVYGNGQRGPCLDMRTLPTELCDAIEKNETDLLVIEGMGRALHTNLYAEFNCETLKLAVIKNKWLAQRLGGDTFAIICKYEASVPLIAHRENNRSTSMSS